MADPNVYQAIFSCAKNVLQNNIGTLGRDLCNQFLAAHDLGNGQGAQANATNLYNYVTGEAQRRFGAQSVSNDQLFQLVGSYIDGFLRQMQNNQSAYRNPPMSFNQQPPYNQSFQAGPSSMFSPGTSSYQGGGMDFPSQQMAPQKVSPPMTVSPPESPTAPAPAKNTNYASNPFDDFPDTGIEFAKVEAKLSWGEEEPADRRIILSYREELKTKDPRFAVSRLVTYHQVVQNNPLDVVKDFFAILPDSVLSSSFLCKVNYTHLDIIDVPTQDFLDIRNQCLEAVDQDASGFLHKKIIDVLNRMSRGPWKAMTNYLLHHVNKALHLAVRLSTNPSRPLRITEFDDLNELLSSSWNDPFIQHPEGRSNLERIVGAALWNALVLNTAAMFEDKESIPTNAMQSSAAFPYSLPGVYPNKFAIPISSEQNAQTFLDNLHEQELKTKSYLLSRRAIYVTNILTGKVLKSLSKTPTTTTNGAAALLGSCVIPYNKMDVTNHSKLDPVSPYISEQNPTDQLEEYLDDSKAYTQAETDYYKRMKPTVFPVDQTIFALQYGVSPSDYLAALDVFTTIDTPQQSNGVILAKKTLPTLTTNA